MAILSSKLQKRFEKIRIQFLFDHPFLSVLALSLPMHAQTNPHEGFETNGRAIFIDETKLMGYCDPQLKYQYAHTLLHILLKHAFRMQRRDAKIWNRSSDIVINLLLSDFERIGERPGDEVLLEKFRDKSVEEVYHALYKEPSNGEGVPDEENPKEKKLDLIENQGDTEAAMQNIDAIIVQAMGAAKKQGNIPASFMEMINEIIRPQIDLETLLYTYMSESFFDKKSDFSRPNRRFIHQNIYLPGYLYERNRFLLYIALDRSMSIEQETFANFLGIIDAVLRISSDFEVTVIPFDDQVDPAKIVRYDAHDLQPKIAFEKGNGGTDFDKVLEYLNTITQPYAALIVLSDGFFKINKAPLIDTLFLISQKRNIERFKPYGDVFYFNL